MKEYKVIIKLTFALLTVLCIGIIFFFSSQVAEVSDGLSRGITDKALRIFTDYEELSESEQEAKLFRLNEVVRSLAHFGLFLLLGVFSCIFFCLYGLRRPYGISFVLCACYGLMDELHQQFLTDGRGFQLIDLVKDCFGALLGGFIALIIMRFVSRDKSSS